MKFPLSKPGRSTSTTNSTNTGTSNTNKGNGSNSNKHAPLNWSQPVELQHPDLPLRSQRPLQPGPRLRHTLHRSTTVSDRFSAGYAGGKSPSFSCSYYPSASASPTSPPSPPFPPTAHAHLRQQPQQQ